MVKTNSHSSIGLSGALLLLFVALKLTDNIDWSWWWVLSPVWLTFAISAAAFVVLLIIDSRHQCARRKKLNRGD